MLISGRSAALATILMIGSCFAAYAVSGREPSAVTVSLRDLDLTTHAGVAAAYARIRNAARSVCGAADLFLVEEIAARDRCVDDAILRAVTTLGSTNLTDYYLAKTHRAHPDAREQISRLTDRGH